MPQRIRHEHLAGRREIEDARREIHRAADHVMGCHYRVTPVCTDAHRQDVGAGASQFDRREHRLRGIGEPREETVAEVLHDMATPAVGDRCRGQDVQQEELRRDSVTFPLGERHEVAQIGEHDRDPLPFERCDAQRHPTHRRTSSRVHGHEASHPVNAPRP